MSKWISALCAAALASAQSVPTFQVGTRLVTVDVLVRSDKGTAVRGLTKDDFTLQDKGKNQTIAVFAVTDTASAPPAKPTPLPPGVASNRISSGGVENRGATVILFDRLNIPVAADQAVVRTKILALLASLKPTDRIGFYSLGNSLTMVQDFNEEAAGIIQAAKRLSTPGETASGSDPVEARLRDALTPMQVLDMTVRTSHTTQAFQTIARHLAGIPGRKDLIWVASDFPLTYGLSAERRENYKEEVAQATNTMSEANIAVYPMDPRGVEGNRSNSSLGDCSSGGGGGGGGRGKGQASNSAACADDASIPANSKAGGLMPGQTASGPSAIGLTASDTMQLVANNTGGKAYYNTNDIGPDVRKVIDEAEVTYTLGFYAEDKALDGKTHDLTVKVAKKPDTNNAQLHYRKSYVADNPQSAAGKHPEMGALIADAFDATSIGVMAASAPDPSKPDTRKVGVRVSLGDLQFEHLAGKWVASFDLGLSMEADNGKPDALSNKVSSKTMNLSLTDAQLKQGLTAGLDVDNSVPAPTQPTHLRVVVQDKSSGVAGSVRIPLSPK
jgi:VWFA-related protein